MIISAIRALFEAISNSMACLETKINKQCETEVLKEKKKTQKRSDKQEDLLFDMINLLEKYKGCMKKTDRIRVSVYKRRIKGVN